MAKHIDLGKFGEELASLYLEKLDYRIVERNWRFKKAEIDIIAYDREVLVFIEVKTKSYDYYGKPEESISEYKMNLLIDAASQYMVQKDHQWEIRFDIISIIVDNSEEPIVSHYKDAFFPGI